MRSQAEVDLALRTVRWGMNDCEISRLTGIPRVTIREWRCNGGRVGRIGSDLCPRCHPAKRLDGSRYTYLLGMYLGDGCLTPHSRGVFRLRIALDIRYPSIIAECRDAIEHIVVGHTRKAGNAFSPGCFVSSAYWQHWPCLLPQHAPGRKHLRKILLTQWQEQIVDEYPDRLLRGLIHSDGSRDLNWVNGKSYPRYSFSNASRDIQSIFCATCDKLGVHWTQPFWKTISIARRPDVAKLDSIIGPKR
jgi:hypothetical protein